MKPRIAILGGGITGLSAAFYALKAGADVTVLEARPGMGGLSSAFDFGDFSWDRFYHCILSSDVSLLQLIEDLGLTEKLRWQKTQVGYFTGDRLYSMSTTADFVRFPAISLWNKIRLALGILYTCSIRDGVRLEQMDLSRWMTRVFGTSNFRYFWEPLLKCKLGSSRKEASAAFIWATITRLYSARQQAGSNSEQLGYVSGGYRIVLNRLVDEISRQGGQIRTGVSVQSVVRTGEGLCITTESGAADFDYVISTIPSKALMRIVPGLSPEYCARLDSAKYLGVVCFVLVIKRSLSQFYVTNLGDENVPFTGIIEMTNLVSVEETAGHHLIYLPKYTAPDDPLFEASEDDLWAQFQAGLQRVFPQLDLSSIERRFLFRERYVQPVPVLRYSSIMAGRDTGIPGLLLANTTQIINSTLNNNAMVQIAREAVQTIIEAREPRPVICPDPLRIQNAMGSS
jgi:protoporphyrinogen oxidase